MKAIEDERQRVAQVREFCRHQCEMGVHVWQESPKERSQHGVIRQACMHCGGVRKRSERYDVFGVRRHTAKQRKSIRRSRERANWRFQKI